MASCEGILPSQNGGGDGAGGYCGKPDSNCAREGVGDAALADYVCATEESSGEPRSGQSSENLMETYLLKLNVFLPCDLYNVPTSPISHDIILLKFDL